MSAIRRAAPQQGDRQPLELPAALLELEITRSARRLLQVSLGVMAA